MRTVNMLAAVLLGATAATPTTPATPAADNMVDLIIIGAGWSGMGAADHIVRAKAGVTFTVLEARNDTGGRTRAMPFGDDSPAGPGKFIVERGSNWICGVGGGGAGHDVHPAAPSGPTTNPVHDLAVRMGMKRTLIPGSTQNMSNYAKVFGVNGTDADPTGALRDAANAALDCVNATARPLTDDDDAGYGNKVTTREAMSACGWNPKTEAEWAVDWVATEDDPGFPASEQAAADFAPDESYMWWGKDDYFVVDQNPRGYAALLDLMVADTLPDGDPRVVFNARVAHIAYDCGGVNVTLSDGSVHRAREVISTLPLGVLQRHHADMFTPPIPAKHAKVLTEKGVVMANLTHVVLQFPKSFAFPAKWKDLPRWVSANAAGPDERSWMSGMFSEWQNLNHATMIPGSNMLLSFLGDPQSSYYEGQPDAVGQAAAMLALRAQNPELSIPDPVAFFISRHGYDELSYGAYAGYLPGWKDIFIETLLTPLSAQGCTPGSPTGEKRVRFSGEATCDDLDGFTHGGLQSGIETAAMYLYDTGKGPNPAHSVKTSLCYF